MEKREDSSVKVYLNGLGLGSIAAAMYLIQKADFNPSNIHIFEQKGDKDLVGESCDASTELRAMANTLPRWKRHEHDHKYPATLQTRGIARTRIIPSFVKEEEDEKIIDCFNGVVCF